MSHGRPCSRRLACREHERCRRSHRADSHNETSSSDSDLEAPPYVGRYEGSAGCCITESVRQVDTVCGSHTYTLLGYTLARSMGAGTRLCSDLFEVGGQLFRLEVYPAGLNADTYKYVSLFLTTPGASRPSHLLYELNIVDRSLSKPQHITESRTAFTPSASEPAAIMAPHPGVVAGFPKFIKANFLHRHPRRFLPDDSLTIRATVKVLTGRSSFPTAASTTQPQVFALYPNVATSSPTQMVLVPPVPPSLPLPHSYGQQYSQTTGFASPGIAFPLAPAAGHAGWPLGVNAGQQLLMVSSPLQQPAVAPAFLQQPMAAAGYAGARPAAWAGAGLA